MSMAEFIKVHMEQILADWENYAKTLAPAAGDMDRSDLRDLAEAILRSVAADMERSQSESQRHQKSHGNGGDNGSPISEVASRHATERLSEGFTLNQVIAEYRALRASVIRRWREERATGGAKELEELTRFNEAIDESLTEAANSYNNRMEDARDLLSGVLAHDLRNPLGAMLTGAEVLLQDETLKPQHTATAARIRSSGTRMRKMIDDLLDFTRTDFTRTRLGTGMPITKANSDLTRVLRNVIGELKAFHPDAMLEWSPTGDLSSTCDAARIEQMLSNLISNAIFHGSDGMPITITAQGNDSDLIVKIRNHGDPISPAEQEVIFDPLRRAAVQVKEGGMQGVPGPGLGLGLYIVREIVEAHGGVILVESSEEEGTTFTVQLPRHNDGEME